MLKYQCNNCGETKDLMRATLEVVKGKVRTKQAQV
jgi:predicted nucleic acid-binding Zn ribbon protein